MTTGVIFDMDGVLVESEQFYYRRRLTFFKEKSLTPGSDRLTDHVGKTDQGIWEMLIPEDPILRTQLHQEYRNYRENHPINYPEALRSEVREILETLKQKNIPIGLASSSARKEIEAMLTATGLKDYFDFVISGEELAESKPHPQIYLIAAANLGCDHYIAVEDSPLGIQAAKAANLYTAALAQEYPLDQSEADIVINDLRELLPLLS